MCIDSLGATTQSPTATLPPLQRLAQHQVTPVCTDCAVHMVGQVLAAIQEQERRLQHTTTIYLNDQIAQYAKELTDRMPGNLKVSLCRYISIVESAPKP